MLIGAHLFFKEFFLLWIFVSKTDILRFRMIFILTLIHTLTQFEPTNTTHAMKNLRNLIEENSNQRSSFNQSIV
jgi:hypothetical protein